MDRRTRLRLGFLVIVVAAAAAAAVLVAARNPAGTTEATGVVVAVDAQSLGNVRGFTLRLPGGTLMEFSLRALQNGTEFAPGHLAEHQATAAPVRVWFRMDGDERLAIRLEDAPR